MFSGKLKYIEIEINLPNNIWISKLSLKYSDKYFKLENGYPISKTERIIFIKCNDEIEINNIEKFLSEIEDIIAVDRIGINLRIHFKLNFLESIIHEQITFLYPIIVKNNLGKVTLISNPNKIKILSKFLNNLKIIKVVDNIELKETLSIKEKEILEIASLLGYFNYPRKITLTDLAKKLKVSKSTLSENLRKIESKLINNYLNKDKINY